MHISSRYTKILGGTNFQPQEFHRRREKTEREEVSVNNGQLRIANAAPGGARKPPGPIRYSFIILSVIQKIHAETPSTISSFSSWVDEKP